MSHSDKCGECKQVENERIAAAKRDLAVKVLEQIEWTGVGNPHVSNPEKSEVWAEGIAQYRKHIDSALERLFTAEGIDRAPLTARKEKEGLSGIR